MKRIILVFCLLGMLLISGCAEQPGEEIEIPAEPEEIIEEVEPIEEIEDLIEDINETEEEVNITAEVVEEKEEITYIEDEISLCKNSSLENYNLTQTEMTKYNYLTGLVTLEQTIKKSLVKNINQKIYTNTTLEAFDTYLTCLNYVIE